MLGQALHEHPSLATVYVNDNPLSAAGVRGINAAAHSPDSTFRPVAPAKGVDQPILYEEAGTGGFIKLTGGLTLAQGGAHAFNSATAVAALVNGSRSLSELHNGDGSDSPSGINPQGGDAEGAIAAAAFAAMPDELMLNVAAARAGPGSGANAVMIHRRRPGLKAAPPVVQVLYIPVVVHVLVRHTLNEVLWCCTTCTHRLKSGLSGGLTHA